jgi:hypothetical protein
MFMMTGAWAADPTAPVAPTIPSLITVSPNAAAALNESSTNRVFIDQSGDNPNVNITQMGSGNRVGSNPNSPMYLRGIDQEIVLIQSGSGNAAGNNNVIDLQVVNAYSGANKGASVTIRQFGNNNSVDAVCGDNEVGCDNANINWLYTGDNNSVYFRATGSDLVNHANVNGSNNDFNVLMDGYSHSQVVGVTGSYNQFNLSQTSYGGVGSSIVINQTGDSTTYNVSQSGSVDSVLNINSFSNNGNFNISQHN